MFFIKDFTEAYAMQRGINKSQAKREIDDFLKVFETAVMNGGVSFKGLFTIKTAIRKGRDGVVNDMSYHTDDKMTLKISVGKDLDEKLNP